MCGLCGLVSEQIDWTDGLITDKPRRQERYLKIQFLNKILKTSGLAISDIHGVNYLIQSNTGGSAIANGLGALWEEIDRSFKKEIDVLDPQYLARLEEETL